MDSLSRLRADIQMGLDELDAGKGEELDIEELIRQAHKEHARSVDRGK
jgi:hypothetical protein